MTRMLASVTNVAEAVMAMEAGVDLVDLKDPSKGALGALDPHIAADVVAAVGSFASTSATIGDFPDMDPVAVRDAVQRTAELRVDYVKIGFWGSPRDLDCATALQPLTRNQRLVAVLFADLPHATTLIDSLASAGFSGAMYDTANKLASPLRLLKSEMQLALFVRRVRNLGMLCGLAGRLRLADVAPLLALRPDYLGFRGALCHAGSRTSGLDPQALAAVRSAVVDDDRITSFSTAGDQFTGRIPNIRPSKS
ncbi:MAG: hypothetical protein FJY37_13515 [Betaproteobacteria bacterium]|nr:hypothetical protein [Betaproteobacteria bacterium]